MKINNLRQTGSIVIVITIISVLVFSVSTKAALIDINNRVIVTYHNSTTTFTNIPGLSFILMPNTVYQFTVSAIFAGTVSEFAVAPLPLGTTFRACEVQNAAYGSAYNSGCTTTTGVKMTFNPGGDGAGFDDLAFFTGSVIVGAVGGVFQMQGANYYSGYTLTVEVNSWIQAQVSSA